MKVSDTLLKIAKRLSLLWGHLSDPDFIFFMCDFLVPLLFAWANEVIIFSQNLSRRKYDSLQIF